MQNPESIQLVEKTDRSYREFIARLAKTRATWRGSRCPDPFAIDHHRVCRDLEEAAFRLFASNGDIQTGLVLKSLCLDASKQRLHEFHEVDFVKFDGTTPRLFGELKFSVSPDKNAREGYKQIAKRLELANQRWTEARGIVICYSTAGFMERGTELPDAQSNFSFTEALADALNASTPVSVYFLKFQTLCTELIERGFIDQFFLQRYRKTFDEMRSPKPPQPSVSRNSMFSLGDFFDRTGDG